MRGRTFDPFASLDYAARLMAAHVERRGGDYREALADYNTGGSSRGSFRDQGYRYADVILEGQNMASTAELEALRADRDANHKEKMGALHHLGRGDPGGAEGRRASVSSRRLGRSDGGRAVLSRSARHARSIEIWKRPTT